MPLTLLRRGGAGAEDIGTWYLILEVLSIVAVICNSAIIFFTGTRFDGYSLYDRAIFFIVFEHALLCIKVSAAPPWLWSSNCLTGRTPSRVSHA